MTKKYWFYLFPLIGLVIASCNNDQKPATVQSAVPKKPVLTEPFRFHKLVEVSPGQDYDVFSWGRGSKDTGSFVILHSDSAGRKYSTTTGDLDGNIADVYNSDMDLDGNPEILIQAKTKDTINYVSIYAFEFSNGKAQKLDFPKLTKSQRAGYHGEDNFYVEQGKLIREFPIYSGGAAAAKPLAEKRKFEYGLRNNSFTIKQLTKDSLSTAAQTAPVPVKKATTEKKTTTNTKKSKKSTPEKTHKKKKKKHHSDEE
ncbi:MAG TPA: hypothetical protein VGN20_27260 [Mucilaginibacter sp.]|jgi:hypothetical protein